MYYIYILRCEDDSLYTGITNNVEKRMNQHFNKQKQCAKYTFSHNAKQLESIWQTENKALASQLEYYIKRLKKIQKEALIKNNNLLEDLLGRKIELNNYEAISKKEVSKNLAKYYVDYMEKSN